VSERYGAPGEHAELLANLEDYCDDEIAVCDEKIRRSPSPPEIRYFVARKEALKDVLDKILVNPDG
jgi:hypothetical protein